MPSPPGAEPLPSDIERSVVERVVRTAFGPEATTTEVVARAIPRRTINGVTRGVWLLDAAVSSVGATSAMPLVGKTIAAPSGDDDRQIDEHFRASRDPAHFNYWLREALVFAEPPQVPAGLRLPTCHAIAGSSDRRTLYLERVEEPARGRDARAFEAVVHGFGVMQAQLALGACLPSWRSVGTLRAFTPDPSVASLRAAPPQLAALAAPALALLGDRETLLGELEAASPRTLCHHDLWATNVSTSQTGSVVFDWAMAGDGTFGEDVANLIFDSAWMLEVATGTFDELRELAPAWYVSGLRDGGWRGDGDAIRSAISRIAAMRFGLLLGALANYAAAASDPDAIDRRYELRVGEVVDRRTHVVAAALASPMG